MNNEIRARYAFTDNTKRRVMIRQNSKCAVCGKTLDLARTHYHHVVATQSAWLLSINKELIKHENNCVAVCGEDEYTAAASCHLAAHNGNFRTGALASGDFFEYSHGRDKAKHKAWCQNIEFIWSTRR